MLQVKHHTTLLLHQSYPRLEYLRMVVTRVIQVDPETLRLRMPGHHQREQLDQALCVQVLVRITPIQVLAIARAVGSQDIQPLAAPADAHLEALPHQQPAAEQHFQTVQRMHAVEEITPPAFRLRGLLVRLVLLDELLLLVRIGLEEEAADLMKGTAQTLEEFAHAAFREPSTEGLL